MVQDYLEVTLKKVGDMILGYLVAVAGMVTEAVLMDILNVLFNKVTMLVDVLNMTLNKTLLEMWSAERELLGFTVTGNGWDVRGPMRNNAFMMEVRGVFVKVSLCRLGGGLCRLRRHHQAVPRRIGPSS